MDKSKAIEVAKYIASQLEKNGIHVEQTILFGSCARDLADDGSDVDIAIISDDFQHKDLFERVDMTMEVRPQAIKQFHVPIDLLTFTPEEYATSPSLAAQFVRADGVAV